MPFPTDFVWGASTSSYQIEGAWLANGKGLSIWDAFAHTPGRIANGSTGDVACDHYRRFREDVALMADMGLPAYRFSVAWPRIQPAGYGPPNAAGLRFYSDLIDALLARDITPWVTLHHWDLPLALHLERDGWLDPAIAERFAEYARLCFEHFGDRVKHWITLNEPWVVSVLGYGDGILAPGRTSEIEPYRAAHQLLRAHARAVDVYRREFQPRQKGIIGIANNCDWREPLTDTAADRAAAQRALEFFLGWFADPIYRGDYPDSMRARLGERLPRFSGEDVALLRGSADYFCINHYSTMYVSQGADAAPGAAGYANAGLLRDQSLVLHGDPAWERTAMGWGIVPWGCRKLLEWIDARYDRPDIVMTENGCAFDDEMVQGAVHDERRVAFLESYLNECYAALRRGVRLRGYFVWSLLDNFEWTFGYSKRFGLHFVDFASGRRTAKASAAWYRRVIEHNGPAPRPDA